MARNKGQAASRHVILSGCSGGGKSTLLAELARRGFATVAEPGRRIVESALGGDENVLPWVSMEGFARRALQVAAQDRMAAGADWVFFDRGLVDAAVALEHATGAPASETLQRFAPYHRQVFLTPPWPEIFATDAARRHGLGDAIAEYERLLTAFAALGYDPIILPKTAVAGRADVLLAKLRIVRN